MIYVYSNSNESLGGVVCGTCAITNEQQSFEDAVTTLNKLEAGLFYMSVHTLNGSYSAKSFVRLMAYVRQNFREKVENIGVGNTFAHFRITLI